MHEHVCVFMKSRFTRACINSRWVARARTKWLSAIHLHPVNINNTGKPYTKPEPETKQTLNYFFRCFFSFFLQDAQAPRRGTPLVKGQRGLRRKRRVKEEKLEGRGERSGEKNEWRGKEREKKNIRRREEKI